jgi:hypothetical protein
MKWPPRSPHLNPIEHLRHTTGRNIRNRVPVPSNLEELNETLSKDWENIPQIQARGGNSRY